MPRLRPRLLAVLLLLPLASCQSMYYGTWEKLGYHKRDILVERVEEARDEQAEAQEQFRDALDAFSAVAGFEGGDLRDLYDRLDDELRDSEAKAGDVRERIESIESVATALFGEWEGELAQYNDPDLRRRSEDKLRDTRDRYEQLIGAMWRAESKIQPVLSAFGDQVLFLKHNLNAQAVASLEDDVVSLEGDVASLIAEMEAAIAEANAFIDAMGA